MHSQESGLKVNQPASFAIRLNGAKGKIDAKVHSPSGAVEECHVSELEPGEHGFTLVEANWVTSKTRSCPIAREFNPFGLQTVYPRDEHLAWRMTSCCQELIGQGYVYAFPRYASVISGANLCEIQIFKSWLASEGTVILILDEI